MAESRVTTPEWDAIDWVSLVEWLLANWAWLIEWLLGCAAGVVVGLIAWVIIDRLQKAK